MREEQNYWQRRHISRRAALRGSALGLAGLAGAALVGCGDDDDDDGDGNGNGDGNGAMEPQSGGTLRLAAITTPGNLFNITDGNYGAAHAVYIRLFDRLFEYDANNTLMTDDALVQEWEQPDPRTYVFTLRRGVSFHDGEPFNAEAVAFNLETNRSHPASVGTGDIAPIESWDTPDDSTVQINLNRGAGDYLLVLASRSGVMNSPKAIEEKGVDITLQPVGTGPFMLEEFVEDTRYSYVRFPDYWQQGLPYLDRITVEVLADNAAIATGLRIDQVDAQSGQGALLDQYDLLAASDDLTVDERGGHLFTMFYMNGTAPPFSDPRAAQAVGYSLNYNDLVQAESFGHGWPMQGFIPQGHIYFDPSFVPYPLDGDPAEARRLLEALGHSESNPLTFKLNTYNLGIWPRMSQAMQSLIESSGLIKVEIELGDGATTTQRIFSLDMNMVLSQWSGRASLFETVNQVYHSSGAFQAGGRAHIPLFDELVEKAADALTVEEAGEAYRALQVAVAEDARNLVTGTRNIVGYWRQPVHDHHLYTDSHTRLLRTWLDA